MWLIYLYRSYSSCTNLRAMGCPSPAMWDHSVTCHPTQLNARRLTPARKAGTRLT